MEGAAYWGAFYRENPEKFVEDYLHINLRRFQKLLLVMMFWSVSFVFIACRGIGKTYLSAIYCVTRSILYPGSKTAIAAQTRGQASQVLSKILYELKPKSPELCAEIDDKKSQINGTNAIIVFKNTSTIEVVTAADSARGHRASILLLDECRLINKDTIDTILKKFLNFRRMPDYSELTLEQRKVEYAKEKNITLWLTSAHFKDSWVFQKCLDTYDNMIRRGRHEFVCGFPYQLSIEEGFLDPEMVAGDMLDSNFSAIKWGMEMEALWYGSDEDAFFDFTSVSKNRRIKYPMLPDRLSSKFSGGSALRITPKQNGEVRVMSADIALMSSKKNKNDATAIFINQLMPTRAGKYINNIVYTESCEGLRTDDQALIIRKLFDEFMCDYLVLDTNGIGLGVFDALARDIVDPNTGEIYPAISCCNNAEMASRCTVIGAEKVIWSIKASSQFNSDSSILLREGFKNGRIRLLATEYDAEEALGELKGYAGLLPEERMRIQLPYINTTLLIDELTKLKHEEVGGRIRIIERAGMRKDRYSSLAYNYYVSLQLENKLTKRANSRSSYSEVFVIKPPKNSGKVVSGRSGKDSRNSWY